MSLTATEVLNVLRQRIRLDKAEFLPKFFKAFPGGYGEGDKFLGVVVPDQRQVAKQFRELSIVEIKKLLESPWHECRLTGLFILVDQFERASRGKRADPKVAKQLVEFYLGNLAAVNNWDLVDTSAPKILGRWLLDHPTRRKLLNRLAVSDVLWERRIAVLATMPLIHAGELTEFLKLAKLLLNDSHDLMHKAIGWMLREVGKQDVSALIEFLDTHAAKMPRTMLRYAIEKRPAAERQMWLKKGSQ